MRFALHLLAALLLIEEYAGCHEDGTADDERLADESRAVTGLGEAAGLSGIRAGEVLRGVCRLLLCDLLCLLSCDLIGKLLLRCDAVGLRQLVGGECRIVAGLELVHRGLLLVQDGLGGRDLGTCLDCCGEKRVEGVIRVHIMAGSDRRAGIDGVQLRQLGVCQRFRLFGGGDQGLGGDGIRLRGIEGGLGVIDGLYCILLALLCLCELRGKAGEDVEVRLCVLEIGLGAGKPVGGNAGVGLCGIDWEALRARNPDISAWVSVDGTPIDYPVVSPREGDPQGFYLNHDFDRNWSFAGCPYLDPRGTAYGRHALVYGHHLNFDSEMFTYLRDAWRQEKFDTLGDMRWSTPAGGTVRLHPAFSLSVDKSFAGIQRFDLTDAAETRAWLADLSAQAGARAEGCDDLCEHATRAVTLVTCTGNFAGGRARTLTVFVG